MCKIEETTDGFKVGDFVYDCNDYRKPVYRIDEIVDNSYICKKVDDESVVLHFGTNYPYLRLWTVKNATNGDVIVDTLDNIILFRKIGNNAFDDVVDYHCVIFNDDTFNVQDQDFFFGWIEDTFFPATKEQRERLLNKINENNYVWNSEEKRLSKAKEHNPKFNVGDWIMDKDGEFLYQVQAVKDNEYWLSDTPNLPFAAENNWWLWHVENNVPEHKTKYVDIDKVCEYLYEWNRKQVERFGSRATLGCGDFTINVREMLEEINS